MTLTQVNSAGIADGAIVNADINNSAAVALSKLATSGTASSSNYLRGDGAWSAIDLSTKLNLTGGVMTGSLRLNDNLELQLGSSGSDLKLFHNGTDSYIHNSTGNLVLRGDFVQINNAANSEGMAWFSANGEVGLKYDNVEKFRTGSGGIEVTGGINLTTNLSLLDNGLAKFGTGDDLQIYHNGTNSYIHNTTGALRVTGSPFQIKNTADNEIGLEFTENGSVDLYFNSAKTFETASTGNIVAANKDIRFTNGSGWTGEVAGKIQQSGNMLYIQAGSSGMQLRSHNGSGWGGWNIDGSNGHLYPANNNLIDIGTASNRVKDLYISNDIDISDNGKLLLGTGDDLQIYHNGSHSYIADTGTGNLALGASILAIHNPAFTENMALFSENGAVELYYDNVKKLSTSPAGVQLSSASLLIPDKSGDNNVLRIGTGEDLLIYHDGSNSHVRHIGTGDLYIEGGAGNAADVRIDAQTHIYMHVNGNESCFFAQQNAHVSLYYDGSQKFYTQSDKVVSAGHHYPESSNSYDLGHSSYRWRNIYVNDMHFANSPENTNSVDGTWGDWTLQEGDENIFMINNRTGKKYKMGLQEVN